ncbi:putative PEP-binding protein [Lachnospiraceae bacterium 54-53]
MIVNGNPVSSGLASGKVFLYRPFSYLAEEEYFEEGNQEKYLDLFHRAVKAAGDELDGLLDSFADKNENRTEIIRAHKEILEDEEVTQMTEEGISDYRKMPGFAVCQAFDEFIGILSRAADPLIAGRASDLKDVRDRILRNLLGKAEQDLARLPGKVVLVTQDLLPSATANRDRKNVLAIVTEAGGSASHSAIIARSSGIPAVSGVEGAAEIFTDGEVIAVDAMEGIIYKDMTAEETEDFQEKIRRYKKRTAETAAFLNADSVMADGTRMEIGLNISSERYIDGYRRCDYVGLFRTEFLYMESDHLPTEEEQFSAYRKVLAHAGGKPVTIRTLDIGGDKNLDYLELPEEENPFLGKRALRFCLDRPVLSKHGAGHDPHAEDDCGWICQGRKTFICLRRAGRRSQNGSGVCRSWHTEAEHEPFLLCRCQRGAVRSHAGRGGGNCREPAFHADPG